MPKTVECYFDLISPPSYLAYTQLPKVAAETGARIVWKPVLVGGIHKATGNRPPIEVPAKARYLMRDLKRYSELYAVPLQWNPHFPFNTLTHQRILTGLLLRRADAFAPCLAALFTAIWVHGRDLTTSEGIAAVLGEAGFAADEMLPLAADPEVKEALRAATAEAVARGAFGVPTFFVGDAMFWGQDRLAFVRDALLQEAAA